VAGVSEFAQASGLATYAHNTTIHFGGAAAKYVRITANSNWGGLVKQYGLSEIRFFYVPVQAREPDPASAKTGVAVDAVLTWRPGREAASHKVYFSTDKQAVADGTALVATTNESRYQPDALEFGRTYFWQIAEVNDAKSPNAWEGQVWSFSTTEFVPIDDFESYTDKEGSRVYETWTDGWTNGSGSVVGYLQAPFAEQTIIHGGKQSMPLEYNNVKTPFYSETERVFDTPQDWTIKGANTLALYFRGYPAVAGAGQRSNAPAPLYVIVEDKAGHKKLVAHSNPEAVTAVDWQQWQIPWSEFGAAGVNLASVKKLVLGVGDRANSVPGGVGRIFIDDIQFGRPFVVTP